MGEDQKELKEGDMARRWNANLPCPLDRPESECPGHSLDEKPAAVEGKYFWKCPDGRTRQLFPGETPTIKPTFRISVGGAMAPVPPEELE